jgi:hypothetical protein
MTRINRPSGPVGARGDDRRHSSRTVVGLLILLFTAIDGLVPSILGADDPVLPSANDAVQAWVAVRTWMNDGETPNSQDEAARLELENTTAVGVILRLDGRVVGRGIDPSGDELAVRRAFGRAMSQALGDRVIGGLPEPWNARPGRRLCLELELAGPRTPLVGGTLAAAARRLTPGVDGVAIGRGDDVAVALPGRSLSTGTADGLGGTLIRLLDELGLPPRDLPELRRLDTIRLERFSTFRLGQASPDDPPSPRSRLGDHVPRRSLTAETLMELQSLLADRIRRWQAPPDPGNPAAPRLWLGDFDPIAGSHSPVEAELGARLLAIRALATVDVDGGEVPTPTELGEAAMSPQTVDLALLASRHDPTSARLWLDHLERESEVLRPTTAESAARRAAALGSLGTDLVPTERFDDAHADAWAASKGLADILGAFDWLCLAEQFWWERHREIGARVESLRAVRSALLARQIEDPSSDLDGSIPIRAGNDEVSDSRCIRLLLGMAALQGIPDEDAAAQDRAARGLSGLIRFVRQLQVTPEEAADLPAGRQALFGIQAGPADPRQPLPATAMAVLALDLLIPSTPGSGEPTDSAQDAGPEGP